MGETNARMPAIQVADLGKCFRIYDRPQDRLKQAIFSGRRRYYRDFWALRNVSFSVQPGESLAIVGRNGSGKSTLLQLICGTLTATEGVVERRGRVAALLELGSGFNPEFTGLENVYLNASLLGLDRQQTRERLDDILAFADIGDFVHQPVKTYSSGMQLRLAFAVITQADADILIVDEALAVGDAVFSQRCMRFIHHCRENKSLLFVSHDVASVTALTDRALWLNQGEVQRLGSTADVIPHYVNFCQRASGAQVAAEVRQGLEGAQQDPEIAEVPVFTPTPDRPHPSIGGGLHHDHRQGLVAYELLEMAYNVSPYSGGNPSSHSDGRVQVETVCMENREGQPLTLIQGGRVCRLRVGVSVLQTLRAPIVGFAVLDRLGQTLFGENTYGSGAYEKLSLPAGSRFEASFLMEWPWLNRGDYAVTVAVASGGRLDHINHCWLNESLILTATPGTRLTGGIFAPPLLEIDLKPVP